MNLHKTQAVNKTQMQKTIKVQLSSEAFNSSDYEVFFGKHLK